MSGKKFCLEKGQLQNVVDAARDEPGSCPKAKEFIEDELGMGKKQKSKEKPQGSVDRVISRKIRKHVDNLLDWF
ncbi:MAG: hypothetical protein KGI33_12335 [Thaumarchaeota archaeon]|nr:hypothetical protein [Nitrososphaerota archaeon]